MTAIRLYKLKRICLTEVDGVCTVISQAIHLAIIQSILYRLVTALTLLRVFHINWHSVGLALFSIKAFLAQIFLAQIFLPQTFLPQTFMVKTFVVKIIEQHSIITTIK